MIIYSKNISKFNLLNIFIKFVIFIHLIFVSQLSLSQELITLNTAFSSPITNDLQTGFGDQVLSEAFKRLGYRLKTVRLPAERALVNANSGLDDGDLLRIGGLQKKYPNLIQVPEKIMDMDVMLFTKNLPNFKVNGWQSVSSYSITILTGWKVFEINLNSKSNIVKTDNVNQLFGMLNKDRTDFIGYSRWSGLGFLKNNNIKNIKLIEPPLISTGLYTYLHKKHKKLVPKLASIIKSMKKDGSIKKLYNRILMPLMTKK